MANKQAFIMIYILGKCEIVRWPEVAKEGFVTTWACIPKTFQVCQGDL